MENNVMSIGEFENLFNSTVEAIMLLQGTKVRNEYVDNMTMSRIETMIATLSDNVDGDSLGRRLGRRLDSTARSRANKIEIVKDYFNQTKEVLGL
jgi:hypothetical protein